jgi:putative IMPACT (imprinted ancient) family translation regulator
MLMKELAAGKYVDMKSRFYAHLYYIDDESDVEHILKAHRLKYKKANHHCYALFLSKNHEVIEKTYDDGEVGHPGKVLLELLKSHVLDHHLIVVSRVFGGIKLGIGGVSKAFKQAANATIAYYQSQD